MDQVQVMPTERRRRRRGLLVVLLLGSSIATFGASAMSLALFTDSAASTGSFTTGTIVLGVTPATAFTVTGMMPGDSQSASLTVANNGTGALRYAMTSSATNADTKGLKDQLQLTIKSGSCSGTAVYSGTLGAAAIGNPATGQDTGDRLLAANSSETLCFTVSLPLASGNAYQNATTTSTFTFDAEQTANN